MRLAIMAGALAFVLTGCAAGATSTVYVYVTPQPSSGSVASDSPTDEPAQATAAPAQPAKAVTVTGVSSKKTKAFSLAGGDYAIVVKGKAAKYGGNVIVDIISTTDSTSSENLTNEIVGDGKAYTYDTNLYGVPAGKYYLDATVPDSSWSVTFTPQ